MVGAALEPLSLENPPILLIGRRLAAVLQPHVVHGVLFDFNFVRLVVNQILQVIQLFVLDFDGIFGVVKLNGSPLARPTTEHHLKVEYRFDNIQTDV